jgi:phosphoglycolate phosphatase
MRGLVAFDLDGVLYSSEPFIGEAYRRAIANVNARHPGTFSHVPAAREILQHVGWPVPVILARLFPTVDATAAGWLAAETLDVICNHVARGDGLLFPGVEETLAELRARGFVLAIASNGRRRYVETVLGTYGLAAHFTELVTVDPWQRPAKAHILRAYVERWRVPPARMVMVGDRASDVEAAAAIGCRFVGCDYGHGYRQEIEGAGPIVATFTALPPVIDRVLRLSRNRSGA